MAKFGKVWEFRTRNFRVILEIEKERGYVYDGDDPDGETQAKLDSGEYVAFSSKVSVIHDCEEIGADYLSGSVYGADEIAEFWQSHRTSPAEFRNSIDRPGICFCHYFPDMVKTALNEARDWLRERHEEAARLPRLRGLIQ